MIERCLSFQTHIYFVDCITTNNVCDVIGIKNGESCCSGIDRRTNSLFYNIHLHHHHLLLLPIHQSTPTPPLHYSKSAHQTATKVSTNYARTVELLFRNIFRSAYCLYPTTTDLTQLTSNTYPSRGCSLKWYCKLLHFFTRVFGSDMYFTL